MKKLVHCAAMGAVVFLGGCGSNSTSSYLYQNTFDNYVEWGFTHNTLHRGNAHSGNWCVEIDGEKKYGPSFTCKLSDVGVNNAGIIKMSAWAFLPTPQSSAEVIVSIGEQGKDAIMWEALRTDEQVDDENKWVQMTGEFTIPENVNTDLTLSIITMNMGTDKVLIDDIAFDLE